MPIHKIKDIYMKPQNKGSRGGKKTQEEKPAPQYSNLVIADVEVTEFLKEESRKPQSLSNLTLEEVEVTDFVD